MDNQTGFDPKRRLCPDGTCTGILGPDGRCGECGRAAGQDDAHADLPHDADVEPAISLEAAFDTAAPAPEAVPTGARDPRLPGGGAAFDPGRRLCDDGACVGIVGPAGVCTICGRRATA